MTRLRIADKNQSEVAAENGGRVRGVMERKKFLELCQRNAVYEKSTLVLYERNEYYPQKIQVWFDKNGKTKNTAILLDKNSNSIVEASLERVDEVK